MRFRTDLITEATETDSALNGIKSTKINNYGIEGTCVQVLSEEAQKRISDLYGYCQDNFFRASKNAVAKRLGEQPADIEQKEPNKQTVPTASWLRGRKKKDDRDER